MTDELIKKEYLRESGHSFCPGCGHVRFLKKFIIALNKLIVDDEYNPDNFGFFAGIGCAALIAPRLKFDVVHIIHGRAIPFASGAKMANPDLKCTIISGDGDLLGIGGAHIREAITKNISMTVFCLNNLSYSMTGNQASYLTPLGAITKTTPQGKTTPPIDVEKFIIGCGGTKENFRSISYSEKNLDDKIYEILKIDDFCFIEVKSMCPKFAKYNKGKMKEWLK